MPTHRFCEARNLLDRLPLHAQCCQQAANLSGRGLSIHNVLHHAPRFELAQVLAFQYVVQSVLHQVLHVHCLLLLFSICNPSYE
ncbi:hypothetical protein D1872_320210 [compost metagenome]